MSTFWTLVKTSLNVNYGFSALRYRFTKEKKRLWEPILIGLAAVLGIGSIVSMLILFMFGLYVGSSVPPVNKPELVLTISFVAAQLMVLIFGLFYIMSAFYFSNDLNLLIPLPLKPSHILGSKFLVIMMNEYLTTIPILLPALIIYGVGEKQGLDYWLKSIVLMLMAPAIPLALGALFVMILMRFVNLRRSKDLFAIIGGFLGLLSAVGINVFSQSLPKGSNEDFVKNFAAVQSGLIEKIGRKFPPGLWATYGLSRSDLTGLGYFILFIAVSVILYLFLMRLGNWFFYRSVLAGQEVTRKRKAVSEEELNKKYQRVSSPVVSMFLREWKLFMRTPIYIMNGLMGMIIAPFLLLMPLILQKNNGREMEQLFEILQKQSNLVPVTLAAVGIVFFTSNLNIIASTAVSREGSSFWISKMIPVSPGDQAKAKLLHAIVTSWIGIVISTGVVGFVFRLPAANIVVVLILSVLGNILITALNLLVDVLRPKLVWTNPQEAVKQNLNGFFGILVTVLVSVLLAGISIALFIAGLPGWLIYIILGMVILVLAIPSLWGVLSLAEYRYRNIEV